MQHQVGHVGRMWAAAAAAGPDSNPFTGDTVTPHPDLGRAERGHCRRCGGSGSVADNWGDTDGPVPPPLPRAAR